MGRNALRLATFLTAGVLVCLTAFARFAPLDAPESRLSLPGTVVLDAYGTVLAHDGRDGIRIPVALEAIAPAMLQATISAEDRRFQRHPGIDALAVARAHSRFYEITSFALDLRCSRASADHHRLLSRRL